MSAIEVDVIGGEDVPRPDIETVRRWIATARSEGRDEGLRAALEAGRFDPRSTGEEDVWLSDEWRTRIERLIEAETKVRNDERT